MGTITCGLIIGGLIFFSLGLTSEPMSEYQIPDDLKEEYESAKWSFDDHGSPRSKHRMSLIERIAKLEAERDRLQGNLDLAVDVSQQLRAENAKLRSVVDEYRLYRIAISGRYCGR